MCLFEIITNLKCPLCGFCRSIISLIQLDIIKSLNYNILTIPLLLFFLNEFYFKKFEIKPTYTLLVSMFYLIVRNLDSYPFY
jgi:hypothetical protein